MLLSISCRTFSIAKKLQPQLLNTKLYLPSGLGLRSYQSNRQESSIAVPKPEIITQTKTNVAEEGIERIRLGERYVLYKLQNNRNDNKLVLLMPWVFAGQKAVRKYRELYHDRGWDVLTVQCHPGMVIWVPLGDSHSHKAMDMMTSHPEIKDRDQIFVHAISGGIYLYFGMWRAMRRNMNKYGDMAAKMSGHIFDSGIYAGGDATANTVARIALDKRPILRDITYAVLKNWYSSMKVHTCDLLQECLDSFADEPSYSPCLFVNAKDDDKIDLNAVDKFAYGLERKGVPVINHKWEKGMHTGHLKEHPKEYRSLLSEFVKQCKME